MVSPLTRWLATLDADGLAAVLVRRPEALAAPVPRDLSALAARLQERAHVLAAVRRLPRPAVQLIEVMQGFGGPSVGRDQLAAAIGRDPDDAGLAATLDVLAQRALLWPSEDGDLRMAGPLWSAFPYPLHLGSKALVLLGQLPLTELRGVVRRLGLPAGGSREVALTAVAARLADPEAARALVAAAPPVTRELLTRAAWHGPLVSAPAEYGAGRRLPDGAAWAVERGLLVADGWQHVQLPGEVGMALRGPDWRAPFDPEPPPIPQVEAGTEGVDREAAAAATNSVGQLGCVLEECARSPVALVKTGGVGARELRRVARAVGCAEPEVRLWLELAYAAGLVGIGDWQLRATDAYDEWLAADAAARLAPVLRAWLPLPVSPLAKPSEGAGAGAVLLRDPAANGAPELRTGLLRLVADLPAGRGAATPEALAAALQWQAPLAAEPPDAVAPLVAGLWAEAHLLGVLAHGALTPVGRALRDGDDAGLLDAARGLLPEAVREALFQADLTAVVPGLPDPALAALLDRAGRRESRGGASTWRFSADSVRAAFDAGCGGPDLLAELRAAAAGGSLPQVLEYLVADVSRRHGAVRVRAVGCVLRADDAALLAEIAGVRALRPLRLTALAPTVLASAKPVEETLAALRAAGYAPVGEDLTGAVTVQRAAPLRAAARPVIPPAPRVPAARAGAPAADPPALARTLLAAPVRKPAQKLAPVVPIDRADRPESVVRRFATHLSGTEQRLLAAAIERGDPVRIGYTNAEGRSSTRVIEPVELDRHLLIAWCHLRDEERMFSLDRIEAVTPA